MLMFLFFFFGVSMYLLSSCSLFCDLCDKGLIPLALSLHSVSHSVSHSLSHTQLFPSPPPASLFWPHGILAAMLCLPILFLYYSIPSSSEYFLILSVVRMIAIDRCTHQYTTHNKPFPFHFLLCPSILHLS